MKDVLEDDDGVVQLGHVEIAADRLEDGGGELWVLLGPRDQLEVQVPDEHLAMLPDHGWRLVHELELPHGHQRAFAAPRPDGGWALVNAFDRGTDSIVSADPGPLFVVPGRAARRAPLQLDWPAPVIMACGDAPELAVRLCNTGATRWVNRADDSARVAGWVLDPAGGPLPGSSPWVVSTGRRLLPDLEPGETVELPATVEAPRLDELAVGRYGLDAVLTSLDLRTARGALHVEPLS